MKLLVFYIALFFLLDLNAQEGRLGDFVVSQLDRSNVRISWTMKAGVSCQSPEVQRSTDSLNFTSIYRYPGVCGGGEEQETYSWIDNKAIQYAKSYYRLKIDEGEFSKITFIAAGTDFSNNVVRLYPQPAAEEMKLVYLEDLGELQEIRMYNSQGNEIQIEGISSLATQPLHFNLTKLPTGIYFLWLEFAKAKARKVKFVKAD